MVTDPRKMTLVFQVDATHMIHSVITQIPAYGSISSCNISISVIIRQMITLVGYCTYYPKISMFCALSQKLSTPFCKIMFASSSKIVLETQK